MLGTGLLLCRFPVVSWHSLGTLHQRSIWTLDWMWHWKMARSNATRTELYCAIVTHRETERNKYRLHRALISCSPFSDRLKAGAGDSRWLASSGYSFRWTIILRRHVQSFRIRFLLCYLMRAKKSCLKCWKHLRIFLPHNCTYNWSVHDCLSFIESQKGRTGIQWWFGLCLKLIRATTNMPLRNVKSLWNLLHFTMLG